MKIIEKISEMQAISHSLREQGKKISVVPTMGFLHEGHASLMKRAKELSDVLIVTIFVNPTQFAPNEDYKVYPRDLERDSKLAFDEGVDYLFVPDVAEMYPGPFLTKVIVNEITKKFEGTTRPTHFEGVALIVAKLFNITLPHIAVFGQKDYQQTLVIKQMVKDLNFPIKIIIAPTMREKSGLAMSSRNTYLSPEHKEDAIVISQTLELIRQAVGAGEKRRKIINALMINSLKKVNSVRLDYCLSADADTLEEPEEFIPGQRIVLLIAIYIGKTRLIDNAVISLPSNISSTPSKFTEGFPN